jgi:hypothetical protein
VLGAATIIWKLDRLVSQFLDSSKHPRALVTQVRSLCVGSNPVRVANQIVHPRALQGRLGSAGGTFALWKHVLGVIRQSSDYTPDLLLDAWRDYRAINDSAFKVNRLPGRKRQLDSDRIFTTHLISWRFSLALLREAREASCYDYLNTVSQPLDILDL